MQIPVIVNLSEMSTLISLITVEVGINAEGEIFRKKLVHNCNKRGVGGGKKSKRIINVEGGFFLISERYFTFIRKIRLKLFTSD